MSQERHNSIIKDLTIRSDEAFIIDAAFKSAEGDVFKEHRNLLSLVGRCIASNQEVTLGLTEQELWDLRARINMTASVGHTTGADLLGRIYALILECRSENLFDCLSLNYPVVFLNEAELREMQNEIPETARCDVEVTNASDRENEDQAEDNS